MRPARFSWSADVRNRQLRDEMPTRPAGSQSLGVMHYACRQFPWLITCSVTDPSKRLCGRDYYLPQHRFLAEDESFAVAARFRRDHPWRQRLLSAIPSAGATSATTKPLASSSACTRSSDCGRCAYPTAVSKRCPMLYVSANPAAPPMTTRATARRTSLPLSARSRRRRCRVRLARRQMSPGLARPVAGP
jgi:hypothetical protein